MTTNSEARVSTIPPDAAADEKLEPIDLEFIADARVELGPGGCGDLPSDTLATP